MSEPNVDKEKCLKCGLCASLYPELFVLEETGAKIKNINTKSKQAKEMGKIKEALKNCPGDAILQ